MPPVGAASALAALLVAAGGCATASASVDGDGTFLETARRDAPRFAEPLGDEELLDVGRGMCDRLGEDGTSTFALGGDHDLDEIQATYVAAVTHLCPDAGSSAAHR